MNKKVIICCVVIAVTLVVCNPFAKSWDSIYQEQEELFRTNTNTFNNAAETILKAKLKDTTMSVADSTLRLSDTLSSELKKIGIRQVEIISAYGTSDCYGQELRFIPDSLWSREQFSVLYIQYNRCDTRSEKDNHWIAEGSEHKHAFGMGGGWLIYSDSDKDPF